MMLFHYTFAIFVLFKFIINCYNKDYKNDYNILVMRLNLRLTKFMFISNWFFKLCDLLSKSHFLAIIERDAVTVPNDDVICIFWDERNTMGWIIFLLLNFMFDANLLLLLCILILFLKICIIYITTRNFILISIYSIWVLRMNIVQTEDLTLNLRVGTYFAYTTGMQKHLAPDLARVLGELQ